MNASSHILDHDANRTAADICRYVRLTKSAANLLTDKQAPSVFFDSLREHREIHCATRFLAQALTPPEAVWWGTLCLWHAVEWRVDRLPVQQRRALRATLQWIFEPNEEKRRLAHTAGKNAKVSTCAGALAIGVFYTGGSISAPDLPPVPAPSYATGRAVGGAVPLAAALQPRKKHDLLHQFLHLGLEVANGHHHWKGYRELVHGE